MRRKKGSVFNNACKRIFEERKREREREKRNISKSFTNIEINVKDNFLSQKPFEQRDILVCI